MNSSIEMKSLWIKLSNSHTFFLFFMVIFKQIIHFNYTKLMLNNKSLVLNQRTTTPIFFSFPKQLTLIMIFTVFFRVNLCCDQICIDCSNEGNQCNQCKNGYYLKKGQCLQCYIGCKTCSLDYQNCTSCFNIDMGINETKKRCYSAPSVDSSSQNYFVTLGIVLLTIISITLIIVIISMCKYCKGPPVEPIQNINQKRREQFLTIKSFPCILVVQWHRINDKIIGEECMICLQEGNCYIQCGHVFHTICLEQWYRHNNLCPLCKSTIPNVMTIFCKGCKKYGYKKVLNKIVQASLQEAQFCDYCRL